MFIFKELTGSEKLSSKTLWKTVFTEDSDAFVDEYYRGIISETSENKIFAIVDDIDASVAAMLHLNPYRLLLCGKPVKSLYIVGVATHPKYRGKGFMKSLMNKAIMYAEDIGAPFIYLTAENEALYTPFGFITAGKQFEIDTDENNLAEFTAYIEANKTHAEELSSKDSDEILITLRDNEYYLRYEKEAATDGGVIKYFGQNGAVTYYLTDEEKYEINITDIYNIDHGEIKKFFTPRPVRSIMIKPLDSDSKTLIEDCIRRNKVFITEPV